MASTIAVRNKRLRARAQPLSIRSYVKDDFRYLELIGEGYKSCHITALLQQFLLEKFKMVMVFRYEYAEEHKIVYELFTQDEMEKDLEDM